MSLKKTLLTLSAMSLFAFNVQAAEQPQPAKAAQNAPAQKQEQKQAEDRNLKAFNQNVSINLVQRAVAVQDNKNIVVLTYEVTNKGKNRIKNLNWISAFTVENQVFFVQEVQTQLDKPIAVKKKENITVTFPLDNLPEPAKQVFASKEVPVGHLTVAKQLDFTNGKKIVVKQ